MMQMIAPSLFYGYGPRNIPTTLGTSFRCSMSSNNIRMVQTIAPAIHAGNSVPALQDIKIMWMTALLLPLAGNEVRHIDDGPTMLVQPLSSSRAQL